MKKVLFVATALVALVSASSCKKSDCVKCSANGVSSTICKDQYNSVGGVSWDSYKSSLIAGGCTESN